MGKKWTYSEINYLIRNYEHSKSCVIKNKIKRSWESISVKACSLGLKRHRFKPDISALLKETPEAYYWVGFLLADGHINFEKWNLRLGLASKDKKHLKHFATAIRSKSMHIQVGKERVVKNNIPGRVNIIDEGHISYVVSAMDKVNLPKLTKKFDWKPKKKTNPPEKIKIDNDDLFISFVVGYIDGDGCIEKQKNRNTTSIKFEVHSSWLDYLELMNKRIHKLFKLRYKKKAKINSKGLTTLSWCKIEITRGLKMAAVRLRLPFLARKWNKIDEIHVTKNEKSEIKKNKIEVLMKAGYSPLEIIEKTGYKRGCVYYIIRNLKK